jgi:hypothetical protein
MFVLCLWVSRKDRGLTTRVCVMIFIGVSVRSAEWLNGLGSENWEKFCTQNYFDRKGIFVGVMFCGPLLVDCLMMLLFFVREAGQLLVQVKRTQFRKQRQDQNKTAPKNSKKKSKKKD